MNKVRSFLLGVALALPLAAFGATGDVAAVGASAPAGKAEQMTSVVAAPQSQRYCCLIYMGTWLCLPC